MLKCVITKHNRRVLYISFIYLPLKNQNKLVLLLYDKIESAFSFPCISVSISSDFDLVVKTSLFQFYVKRHTIKEAFPILYLFNNLNR